MPGIEERSFDRAVYGSVTILYEFSGNAKTASFEKKTISKAATDLNS